MFSTSLEAGSTTSEERRSPVRIVRQPTAGKTRRIMVISSCAEVFGPQLAKLGYDSCSAWGSPEQLLEQSLREKPDVLMIDMDPGKPAAALELARRIQHFINVPVVFCIDPLCEESLKLADGLAPFGYVFKPVDARDLRVSLKLSVLFHSVAETRRKVGTVLALSKWGQTDPTEVTPLPRVALA